MKISFKAKIAAWKEKEYNLKIDLLLHLTYLLRALPSFLSAEGQACKMAEPWIVLKFVLKVKTNRIRGMYRYKKKFYPLQLWPFLSSIKYKPG